MTWKIEPVRWEDFTLGQKIELLSAVPTNVVGPWTSDTNNANMVFRNHLACGNFDIAVIVDKEIRSHKYTASISALVQRTNRKVSQKFDTIQEARDWCDEQLQYGGFEFPR